MNTENNSNIFQANRRGFLSNRLDRIFKPAKGQNNRVGLTDELSEVENETALMNVDALKSVTADGEGKTITRLSSMYRRQLALSARVALPDGQIFPSIFFTI
jgi:hypothetical protein